MKLRPVNHQLLDLFEFGLRTQRSKRSASWFTRGKRDDIEFLAQVRMLPCCGALPGEFERRPGT